MTPVRLFLLISFAFSWSCFGALYLLGGLSGAPPLGMTVLIMLAMFGPAIAALVCTMKEQTEQRVRSLGLNLPDWKRALLWLPYCVAHAYSSGSARCRSHPLRQRFTGSRSGGPDSRQYRISA